MTSALVQSRSPNLIRTITHRTRGLTRGPVTRLMSPSDLGEILKPFVFLDLFDHEGPPFNGALHPHSGIATLTYVAEGAVTYIDPNGERGILTAGGVEWMQAGRGMWHGGGLDQSGRTRGFQLWIALPPELELGPTISLFQASDEVRREGPARVLLGSYRATSSAIESPAPINYLAVHLNAGQSWRYTPPLGHTVLWIALASGTVSAPDMLRGGDLAVFAPSNEPVEFEALSDTEFVLGSAAPHEHDLVTGYYSVHTSQEALRDGETHILSIRNKLRSQPASTFERIAIR
jgi:redox-sensitive bicupin YhaK (pirin superfamily)